ncbi:MAG: metallophosphoesterase [Planctomycetia bacterium]|nr:metallophosphoesterase [Planctomycetia bacterium]
MKKRFLFPGFLLLAVSLISVWTSLQAAEPYVNPALKLSKEGNWTLAVIPDPQQYTNEKNTPIFEIMMNWLVECKVPLNIQQAVCVGDIVNGNKSISQWEYSSKGFKILDGVYPYALCTGNHDHGGPKATADARDTNLSTYYPESRNPAWKGVLVEMGPNSFGKKTLELAAYEQKGSNGHPFVIVSLPFAPTDANLQWAKDFCAQKKYDRAFIVVITHDYLLPHFRDNIRDPKKDYKIQKADGNSGEEIWQKLVYPSKNIRMVICGHHSSPIRFSDCTGFRKDKNSAGKDVCQMIFDTQALGGGWRGNGGDGWIRLLEFNKEMDHVKAKTFSPLFDISPSTRHLAVERASYNEFEFDIK